MNSEVMFQLRADIDKTRSEIAEIYNYTTSYTRIVVPEIKGTGILGRITQKNKNNRNSVAKAKVAQNARIDDYKKQYNTLHEKLGGLYNDLINAIPEETKTKLETYNFHLVPGTTKEDPYYIKEDTNRPRKYASGRPYIEDHTKIFIDDNIVKNVEDFIAWEDDIPLAKEREAKAARIAEEKPKKDQLIIDRYVAKGYTYIPKRTKQGPSSSAQYQGYEVTSTEEIPAFLEYKIKSYSDKPDWTQTTETIKHTLKEENNSPIEVQCKINIWTRELPKGFPQRIEIGSDDFYKTIDEIEKTSGGKRSKRKTF